MKKMVWVLAVMVLLCGCVNTAEPVFETVLDDMDFIGSKIHILPLERIHLTSAQAHCSAQQNDGVNTDTISDS